MPQLRHTCHRDFEYISDVYLVFGLCLSGNRQADSHQAPFDATTEVTAKHIDMETIAQRGVRHGGSFLYGRGYPAKSFKSVRGRQRVDTAPVGATVPTGHPQNQRSVSSLALGRSAFYVRLICPLLIIRQFSPAAPRLNRPSWLLHSTQL